MKKLVTIIFVFALAAACLACGDDKYVGTYAAEYHNGLNTVVVYLELKPNNKCTTYSLNMSGNELQPKDELIDGETIFSGTYKIKDDKITLTLKYENALGAQTEVIGGKILSNGKIQMDELSGRVNIRLTKQ